MYKKQGRLLLVTILLISILVGCSSSNKEDNLSNENIPVEETGDVRTLEEAFAEQPVILTSIGQSADMDMVKTLMDNADIEYEAKKDIIASELSDENTIVMAVGGSSKGLGAAGINAEDEIKRAKDLIEEAKNKDIKLIAMHIGGKNRRGELSDKFIEPSVSVSDYIIVVESGNEDGLFTDIAISNDIPLASVSSISEALEPLEKAFK